MSKRLFEWRYGQAKVAVPSVAAFLDGYEALCRQHGMCFEVESESDYDGGSYTTVAVVPFDGDLGRLDCDSLDEIQEMPEAAAIKQRLEDNERAERAAAEEHAQQRRLAAAQAKREELEKSLKSDGLTLSDGKKYKLVPTE